MIVHRVTSYDTMQTIALEYFGSADSWMDIVKYNGLTYPYIVEDAQARFDLLHAFGTVLVKRVSFASSFVLPKGTKFETAPYTGTPNVTKVFEVAFDTVLPAGVQIVEVPLRSVVAGTYGNVMPSMIVKLHSSAIAKYGAIFEAVGNTGYFRGGKEGNVVAVGETLLIPVGEIKTTQSLKSLFYGEDLLFDDFGVPVVDRNGDIGTIDDIENIRRSIARRIMTAKGSNNLHKDYGTSLEGLIGSSVSDITARQVAFEITNSIYEDDRVSEVEVQNIEIVNTTVYADVMYKIFSSDEEIRQLFVINDR